jgi:hypothetical protein
MSRRKVNRYKDLNVAGDNERPSISKHDKGYNVMEGTMRVQNRISLYILRISKYCKI